MELLVIGIDGATFKVINPLRKRGILPNIDGLIKEGVRANLESTFPPVSPAAWTSLATGKNPGKTGVFDGLNVVDRENFELNAISSSDIRKSSPFWDYLDREGKKIGIINYPFLNPVYEVNGFMVSGIGSDPNDSKVMYPPEIKKELMDRCENYRIHVPWHKPKYRDNVPLFLKHISEVLNTNEEVLNYILTKELDLLIFVISASDFIQHYMWKYIDPEHPDYEKKESRKYRPYFRRFWHRIDKMVGTASKAVNKNKIIVSDHGFGPHRGTFFVNRWLEQNKYLKRKWTFRVIKRKLGQLFENANFKLYTILKKLVEKANKLMFQKEEKDRSSSSRIINLDKTISFCPPNSSLVGKIYLNLNKKNLTQEKVATLKRRLITELEHFFDEHDLKITSHLKKDLYHGKFTKYLPEVVFSIKDFEYSIRAGFNRKTYYPYPRNPHHSGKHKKKGIFIGNGPDFRNGELNDISIYDIAPTILHMFGIDIDSEIDGKVLKEVFKKDSEFYNREVCYEKPEKERVRHKIKNLKDKNKI